MVLGFEQDLGLNFAVIALALDLLGEVEELRVALFVWSLLINLDVLLSFSEMQVDKDQHFLSIKALFCKAWKWII